MSASMSAAAVSLGDWKSRAAGVSHRGQAFIDGAYVDARSGRTLDCVNPADDHPHLQQAVHCIMSGHTFELAEPLLPGRLEVRQRIVGTVEGAVLDAGQVPIRLTRMA